MWLCLRRFAPGELVHELLWLSVSLSSLVAAAAWLALGLPWPHCAFHELTGLPCVTCGATRSAIAFFHGNIVSAWKWNPLVFACFCGLSIINVYGFVVVVTGMLRWWVAFVSQLEQKSTRLMV